VQGERFSGGRVSHVADENNVLIRVDDVRKVYKRDRIEVPVLDGTNLSVARGEFMALMGPSGSGKTTLLNLIAGIDRPTSGHVRVGEHDLGTLGESALARWRSTHVGFIFQLYNLIPVLTAFENVEMPLLLTRLGRKKRREHVMTALQVVGLADRVDHYPRQLSGGQEQRVAIARAIVADPVLLVADEPTGDLDAKSAEEVLGLMVRLNTEFQKTILMVTHDAHAASKAHSRKYLEKGVLSDRPVWEEGADASRGDR
jgi:putative ABC transport system ATP-binding protein